MYNWVNEFERSRTSTRDEPHSGHPVEAAMPEIIEKVHDMILKDPSEFLRRYIIDEPYIHFHTPETKEQSKQWTAPGEPAPKKAKTVKSADKVIGTAFWDANGIIFINYL